MPHWMGVAIALDYLSRVYLPDPSDELPPLPSRPAGQNCYGRARGHSDCA